MSLTISSVILITLLAISIGVRQVIVQQLGLNSSLESIVVTPNQNTGGLSVLGTNIQTTNDKAAKIDDAAVAQIASLPHVASADPIASIWEFKKFTVSDTGKTFVAQANGINAQNASKVDLSSGKVFASGPDNHEVILGFAYAKELGFENNPHQLIGKTVTITTQDGYRGQGATIPVPRSTRAQFEEFGRTPTTITAKITGITTADSHANQLLIPMEWARNIKSPQSYNGTAIETIDTLEKNGYSTVAVAADDVKNVQAITAKISDLGYGFISTQQQINRITSLTTIMWGVLGSVAAISLVTAALGIVNTMLTTIAEQRYAIGVWRAVGARRRTIALRFIIQAGVLGLTGGALGALAGWGISIYANHYIAGLLAAQQLPASDVITVSPLLAAASVIITTTFGILAGLYPAWRAAREDPSAALTSQ